MLDVARSSVSLWVRDVSLTDAGKRRIHESAVKRAEAARTRRAEGARSLRRRHQARGRRFAQQRSASYAAGCMLYWAEGSKARNTAQMSNSDPELLAYFAEFLREHFKVEDERFRVTCNLFADHLSRQREIEQFWLKRLGLPAACLRKSIVNRYSKYSKKLRQNKLPYGTCRLSVHSTEIVQTIYGSIQEYGGFERPEWLD